MTGNKSQNHRIKRHKSQHLNAYRTWAFSLPFFHSTGEHAKRLKAEREREKEKEKERDTLLHMHSHIHAKIP